MKTENIGYQQAFTAKFVPNKAFQEVVKYAEDNKILRALDDALHRISNANDGDIIIIHGTTKTGDVYSNFRYNNRSSLNLGAHKTPEEASFEGIQELSCLGRKFRSLVGGNPKNKVTAKDIMKNYTSKIEV